MAKPQPDSAPRPDKIFPVSWDQFHRDARALAWRLADAGPFDAIVAITRGGLVPAAIVARELGIRLISLAWIRRLLDDWPGVTDLFERNALAVRQIRWHQRYLAALPRRGSSARASPVKAGR